MNVVLCAGCMVVLVTVVLAAGTHNCGGFGASDVVISVATRRNATGHWNIAVDVKSDDARRLSARPHERGVDLTLAQRTSFCDLTDSVNLFASAVVTSGGPPAGYELVLGLGYYRAHSDALAWEDAMRRCEAEGAHLLVANSDAEAGVVREFFARKPTFRNHTSASYVHLGFHDRYKEGEFVTVYGEPLAQTGYVQWDSGQPSGGTSHNCGIANTLARLLSHPCNNRYAFICEYGA